MLNLCIPQTPLVARCQAAESIRYRIHYMGIKCTEYHINCPLQLHGQKILQNGSLSIWYSNSMIEIFQPL